MKVLAVNCGSSTLKFELHELDPDAGLAMEPPTRVAGGIVERIGGESLLDFGAGGLELREARRVSDHGEAIGRVLEWLEVLGAVAGGARAVGHRVVHGGDRLAGPALIDADVLAAIAEASELAPLHNRPALEAIRAALERLPGVPGVATFDTAFHRTIPERSYRYAIPVDLADRHRIRRYGFHGLAHRYMTERYAALTSTPIERTRLVTLQLGSGSSAAAVDGGRSVDTSMGFTPLEGLMMRTRSGDLDPAVVGFLARREGVGVDEVEGWLNHRSGLVGISGRPSGDVRELVEAELDGDPRAALALEMYCYRARKYVGAYLSALGGADAVVFGGGIGEHQPSVRARICAGLAWFGLTLDEERNAAAVGTEGRISADGATLQAFVIPVNEMAIIARDTLACLRRAG